MTCPRCAGFLFVTRGDDGPETVCINCGHRITQQAPLPDPREEPPASVLRQRRWRERKAKSQGIEL